MKRPIIIREIRDGLGCQGYGYIWRAYGLTKGSRKEFQLPDNRYDVLYPLDASNEKSLRRLCAKQFPGHPVIVKT